MLNKNPLAVIEDEKNGHQEKLRKMTNDMEDVFQRKVEEKQEKMNKVEREDMERLEKEKKHLKEEKIRLASKKEELESDKKSWAQTELKWQNFSTVPLSHWMERKRSMDCQSTLSSSVDHNWPNCLYSAFCEIVG